MEKKNVRNLLIGMSAVAVVVIASQCPVYAKFDCCEVFENDDLKTPVTISLDTIKTAAMSGGAGGYCKKNCGQKSAWVKCDAGWYKKALMGSIKDCAAEPEPKPEPEEGGGDEPAADE